MTGKQVYQVFKSLTVKEVSIFMSFETSAYSKDAKIVGHSTNPSGSAAILSHLSKGWPVNRLTPRVDTCDMDLVPEEGRLHYASFVNCKTYSLRRVFVNFLMHNGALKKFFRNNSNKEWQKVLFSKNPELWISYAIGWDTDHELYISLAKKWPGYYRIYKNLCLPIDKRAS